ncbi:hypothetical protein P168DRAFT_281668 [Aspergillus campestris IBT 28561]|uniref:Uncharacterized protein n=1 Tax=Aspergillus campestris (strain IBT 28561) TaxID=1392248 RepID=A0A2I1D2A0_ASPC2|nr:uncharacterized protein P168DRAFT_281668 [Aspergillus campestris IBT 28561]PKY04010.1 hypothetical protein P168DRAFT_281668 [Aspergillus campestris IBT 28561]
MGSFLSIQSKDKRRRSNRLSKPPPNPATLVSVKSRVPDQASNSTSAASSNSAAWQNSWTVGSSPGSPSEAGTNGHRSQSLPSPSLQLEAPREVVERPGGRGLGIKQANSVCLRSPTSSSTGSGPLARRTSLQEPKQTALQPAAFRGELQHLAQPAQPQRSHSSHTPARQNSFVYNSTIEEATCSNTHFMVDSQGFSLIRRRSLLTRPGVATRRSTRDVPRRLPSPIRQDDWLPSRCATERGRPPQWPLRDHEEIPIRNSLPVPQFRPPTPSDFEYTHLGALKLGSLRVVNGSASPCPSDRTLLNRPSSPSVESSPDLDTTSEGRHRVGEHASFNAEASRLTPSGNTDMLPTPDHTLDGPIELDSRIRKTPSTSTLQIPPDENSDWSDNLPSSPFSFEKSPTTAVSRPLEENGIEDEGIHVAEDDRSSVHQRASIRRNLDHGRSTRSRKVDSGYSSAASIRSLQDSRARASIDSQVSSQRHEGSRRFTLGGNSKDFEASKTQVPSGSGYQLPVRRHLSLQGPGASSRAGVGSWATDKSSMCHDTPKTSASECARSLSTVSYRELDRSGSLRYCTQLRSHGFSTAQVANSVPRQARVNAQDVPGTVPFYSQPHGTGFEVYQNPTSPSADIYPEASRHQGAVTAEHGQSPNQNSQVYDGLFEGNTTHESKFFAPSSIQVTTGNLPTREAPQQYLGVTTVPAMCTPTQDDRTGYELVEDPVLELQRGRTRSRTFEYQRCRLPNQQEESVHIETPHFIYL